MATTTVSVNSDFTLPIEVPVKVLDVTKFALVDTKVSDDGLNRESVYQLMAGNTEFPLSFRVGHYKNPKANGGVGATNISVKFVSYAEKTDVDDVIWTLPETWTLAKSAPGGNPFYDTDVDLELIGSMLSIIFSVGSGLFTLANVNELKFGVTNRVLEHANTAAA